MKTIRRLLILVLLVTLSACETEQENKDWVVLPDLNGKVESEIITQLDQLGLTYEIEYLEQQHSQYSLQFIMYDGYDIGDIVDATKTVTVIVYPDYVPDTIINLPDYTDMDDLDVIEDLLNKDILYYTRYIETDNTTLDGLFAGYVEGLIPGEEFDNISALGVLFYEYVEPYTAEYFQPIDMEYDGPHLDANYATIDYLNPRGGYFEVTLRSCTDGDTAKFNYPQDVYDSITSTAKSSRFLNMDTEETYGGGEEEWGKPASVYTCALLEDAETIILQTDPGDSLLGTHGRLLAWIWIQLPDEDEFFLLNYMVVKQGLAQVKYEFGAGLDLTYGEYTYNEWMHLAEDYAIANDLGQWGNKLDYYWNYEDDEPYFDRWYQN